MQPHMTRCMQLLLCAAVAVAALLSQPVSAAVTQTPNSVVIHANGSMIVDGAPFIIQGIGQTLRALRPRKLSFA